MLPNNAAVIDFFARHHKHHAAILQIPQGKGHRLPRFHADQRAIAARAGRGFDRAVMFELAVHDGGATGIHQQLTAVTDHRTGGCLKDQALFAMVVVVHLTQLGAPQPHFLHHHAGKSFIHINDDFFIGFLAFALHLPHNDLWA